MIEMNRTVECFLLREMLLQEAASAVLVLFTPRNACQGWGVSLPMFIRHLRTRRPQLIPNFEQYRFCYSLLTQISEPELKTISQKSPHMGVRTAKSNRSPPHSSPF
ncbi:hypothetical protein DPMN_107278 [Dreissena polymorpha]|uniref:Uncharacterized protein n=1 Tax=Dreissena polymorpha TaxID=45954 RepID=A0A9D4K6F4_DREPO|nr:hypothetical protein DPMN_107278 [Dreissena polymorpha]